jgi:hypothetical protein
MYERRVVVMGSKTVHVHWVGPVPLPRGVAALTLGRLVLVAPGVTMSDRLIRHEHRHVEQYQRFGLFGFLLEYLSDYFKLRHRGLTHLHAYAAIRFEVEARSAENLNSPGHEQAEE